MIIMFHEKGHSKRFTANKFGIETKQLRDWIKNKEKLLNVAPYTQRLNIGARPKYPHLEDELIDWVKEARNQLKTVSRYMIQSKARLLAKKSSYQTEYSDIKNAKFSQSFKCCGISNAMDGTEDTLIFDFNRLENKVNREDLGREIDFERKDNESDDEDSDYNESESKLEDSDEMELEDSDKSELEDNYYEENEEQNVIQDWN